MRGFNRDRVNNGKNAGYLVLLFVLLEFPHALAGHLYDYTGFLQTLGFLVELAIGLSYVLVLYGVREVALQIGDKVLVRHLDFTVWLSVVLTPLAAASPLLEPFSELGAQILLLITLLVFGVVGVVAILLSHDFRRTQEQLGVVSKRIACWHAVSGYLMVTIILSPLGILLSLVADLYMWKLLRDRVAQATPPVGWHVSDIAWRPLFGALVVGIVLVTGVGLVAAYNPGTQNAFFQVDQEQAEALLMRALTEHKSDTPEMTAGDIYDGGFEVMPESSVDTLNSEEQDAGASATGKHSRVEDGVSAGVEHADAQRPTSEEWLQQIFVAVARADKESFVAINGIDYERIYDVQVFEDGDEIRYWIKQFAMAYDETSAENLARYYELRLAYGKAVVVGRGFTQAQEGEMIDSYLDTTAYMRPYVDNLTASLRAHMAALTQLYTFMDAQYGRYDVEEDEDGYPTVVFEDGALETMFITLATDVDVSSEEIMSRCDESTQAMNEHFKQKGYTIDVTQAMDAFYENYY